VYGARGVGNVVPGSCEGLLHRRAAPSAAGKRGGDDEAHLKAAWTRAKREHPNLLALDAMDVDASAGDQRDFPPPSTFPPHSAPSSTHSRRSSIFHRCS